MKEKYTKNKPVKKDQEDYELSDFNTDMPEIVNESMDVKPKYKGKLRMLKTSVSLPGYVIDDLRQMTRIKGMTSYQAVLRELLSERYTRKKNDLICSRKTDCRLR